MKIKKRLFEVSLNTIGLEITTVKKNTFMLQCDSSDSSLSSTLETHQAVLNLNSLIHLPSWSPLANPSSFVNNLLNVCVKCSGLGQLLYSVTWCSEVLLADSPHQAGFSKMFSVMFSCFDNGPYVYRDRRKLLMLFSTDLMHYLLWTHMHHM